MPTQRLRYEVVLCFYEYLLIDSYFKANRQIVFGLADIYFKIFFSPVNADFFIAAEHFNACDNIIVRYVLAERSDSDRFGRTHLESIKITVFVCKAEIFACEKIGRASCRERV